MIFLSETTGRDLARSDVIGRGVGRPLHGLPGRFQSRKKLVSRGLANFRDEDFRLLSVLVRRVLDRLD